MDDRVDSNLNIFFSPVEESAGVAKKRWLASSIRLKHMVSNNHKRSKACKKGFSVLK